MNHREEKRADKKMASGLSLSFRTLPPARLPSATLKNPCNAFPSLKIFNDFLKKGVIFRCLGQASYHVLQKASFWMIVVATKKLGILQNKKALLIGEEADLPQIPHPHEKKGFRWGEAEHSLHDLQALENAQFPLLPLKYPCIRKELRVDV